MRGLTVGTVDEFPTRKAALRSPTVQSILLKLNISSPHQCPNSVTVGELCGRYEKEEFARGPPLHPTLLSHPPQQLHPPQVGRSRVGGCDGNGGGRVVEKAPHT